MKYLALEVFTSLPCVDKQITETGGALGWAYGTCSWAQLLNSIGTYANLITHYVIKIFNFYCALLNS